MVGSKMRKVLSKVRGDTIDHSWGVQATVRGEAEEAAENLREISRLGNDYANQMMGMQSLMTKKILVTYQLQEALEQQPFLSLYSDVCEEGEGSLPFDSGNDSEIADTPAAAAVASLDSSFLELPSGETPALRSNGVKFLKQHLQGVPDLAAPSTKGRMLRQQLSVPVTLAHTASPVRTLATGSDIESGAVPQAAMER